MNSGDSFSEAISQLTVRQATVRVAHHNALKENFLRIGEPSMFPIFSGLTRLAGSIIDVWTTLDERAQRRLDREHQRRLQKAQHDHENLLQARSTRLSSADCSAPNLSDALLERLRIEAILLSGMGVEIVYEPIGKGYGLAVPVTQDLILAFWLSISSYPDQPPDVYMKTPTDIEKIEFEADAWEENHTIAEIVSAMTR